MGYCLLPTLLLFGAVIAADLCLKYYERVKAFFLFHSLVSHTQLVFLCSICRDTAARMSLISF